MSKKLVIEYIENLQTEFIIIPLAFGIYKLYQRFLSVAARQCKGLSGKEKTMCMLLYKIKTFEKAKQDLRKYQKVCRFSPSPAKCIEEIADQIAKVDVRLQGFKEELDKLMS